MVSRAMGRGTRDPSALASMIVGRFCVACWCQFAFECSVASLLCLRVCVCMCRVCMRVYESTLAGVDVHVRVCLFVCMCMCACVSPSSSRTDVVFGPHKKTCPVRRRVSRPLSITAATARYLASLRAALRHHTTIGVAHVTRGLAYCRANSSFWWIPATFALAVVGVFAVLSRIAAAAGSRCHNINLSASDSVTDRDTQLPALQQKWISLAYQGYWAVGLFDVPSTTAGCEQDSVAEGCLGKPAPVLEKPVAGGRRRPLTGQNRG